MKFSAQVSSVREVVQQARGATPSTPALVAYSGVYLSVDANGVLTATGADGDLTISASTEVQESTPGDTLLLPKPILGYLGSLPKNEMLSAELTENGDFSVSCSGGKPYSFRPIAATFPNPPRVPDGAKAADLSRLALALSAVRDATSRDNPGVQVVSSKKAGLVLHSTDSYRLSKATLSEASIGDFVGVVPLSTLDKVAKLGVGSVAVDPVAQVIAFTGDACCVTSRLMAVPFPPVEAVLGNKPKSRCVLPVPALLKALTRLASVAEEDPVRVSIEGDKATLTAQNIDLGAGSEEVSLSEPADDPIEFLIRIDYLIQALSNPGSESVDLLYSGPVNPFFITGSDPVPFTHVVMPVRA